MTHDELVKKLTPSLTHTVYFEFGAIPILNALRATVELHRPFSWNSNNLHLCCIACADFDDGDVIPAAYPCPTIQAIEKELA